MSPTISTRTSLVLLAAALCGCASSRSQDLLEARLREQEEMLSSYQSQLDRMERDLELARRESDDLRGRLAGNEGMAVPADEADAHYRAMGVQFSPLMTGGADLDQRPGDDAVAVVVFPHDAEGETVKLPGSMQIEAFDLSRPEGAQRIGQWSFNMTETRRHWHKGVIQSGYQFELPWQEPPQSDKVLLHGRLVTTDGRQFDATHTIRVSPPATDPQHLSSLPHDSGIEQVSAVGSTEGGVHRLGGFDVDNGQMPSPSRRYAGNSSSAGESVIRLGDTSRPDPGSHQDTTRHSPLSTHQSSGRALTGREFADRMNIDVPLEVAEPIGRSSPWGRDEPPRRNSTPWSGAASRQPQPVGHSTEPSPDTTQQANDPATDPNRPRPFPTDLIDTSRPTQTSDAWTDETIPYLR